MATLSLLAHDQTAARGRIGTVFLVGSANRRDRVASIHFYPFGGVAKTGAWLEADPVAALRVDGGEAARAVVRRAD